jgi:adenosylcobinamide kinase/adenosylcobinamide-phosphate guanylyltransferase
MVGKTILVTGGARSGKSSYAEKLATEINGEILYIATAVAFDDEMKSRIKKHQQSRPIAWDTYEGYRDLDKVIKEMGNSYKGILLDCITVMTTNLLMDFTDIDFDNMTLVEADEIEEQIKSQFEKLMKSLENVGADIIMVTNELGCGIVPENKLARFFRDVAGRVNQYVASNCEEVYLTVCGIPMKIK